MDACVVRRAGRLHRAQPVYRRLLKMALEELEFLEQQIGFGPADQILSFVPDPEQRLWRTVTRRKHQLTRLRVRMHNQLESLLGEDHIKLSSLVSDLLGVSARRMLQALAKGKPDPGILAARADKRLGATPAQLCDALGACT